MKLTSSVKWVMKIQLSLLHMLFHLMEAVVGAISLLYSVNDGTFGGLSERNELFFSQGTDLLSIGANN